MKQFYRMTEQEFKLIVRFLGRKILTDVDGGLRRAVESLFRETSALREELQTEYGKELASDWWKKWEEGTYEEELKPKQLQHLKTTTVPVPKTDHKILLKFRANTSTRDGRLSKGKLYSGYFVKVNKRGRLSRTGSYWRIYLPKCDLGHAMTFNPDVFDYAGK